MHTEFGGPLISNPKAKKKKNKSKKKKKGFYYNFDPNE